jgi:F420-dependent oxidoreductase-like protein
LGRGGYEALAADVAAAAEAGFDSYWLPQIVGNADAMTLFGSIAREVPGIGLGTSVVPTYPRHPMVMAEQARTVNLMSGGRFNLGIGLSHQPVVEGMWGYSFDRPLRHAREYLEALMPLVRGEVTRAAGETITARGQLTVGDPDMVPPVYLAALGPQMLKLAGRLCDGTVTWMTGAKTLGSLTVPAISEAAAAAGRPDPEIVAGLPVWVTDNPDHARTTAARVFEMYGQLPSYRAMLDREGIDGPADLAIIGDEDVCRGRVDELGEAGVTLMTASEFADNPEDRERTRAFLASRL